MLQAFVDRMKVAVWRWTSSQDARSPGSANTVPHLSEGQPPKSSQHCQLLLPLCCLLFHGFYFVFFSSLHLVSYSHVLLKQNRYIVAQTSQLLLPACMDVSTKTAACLQLFSPTSAEMKWLKQVRNDIFREIAINLLASCLFSFKMDFIYITYN